jgi:hypothetical protein
MVARRGPLPLGHPEWALIAPDARIETNTVADVIARANEANQRTAMIAAAVEALASAAGSKTDQTEAMKTLIGYGTETPADLAKRFDHLVAGSVEPQIDREIAVRLFMAYPIVGYTLTNKILELTGLGPDLGKAPDSTPTPASLPA